MSAWKPGDVAIVKYSDGPAKIAIWVKGCCNRGGHFHTSSGTTADGSLADWVRPLVVIDPEDRKQVERLHEALGWIYSSEDNLQAALRSLIPAPKPDEPLGDGAIIEDAEGRRWVRIPDADFLPPDHPEHGSPPWRRRGGHARWWDRVPAVRVLSEGVQP